MNSSKHKHLDNLRFDDFIKAVVKAIPNAPPPTNQSAIFEERKKALKAKLKAEMALASDKTK